MLLHTPQLLLKDFRDKSNLAFKSFTFQDEVEDFEGKINRKKEQGQKAQRPN